MIVYLNNTGSWYICSFIPRDNMTKQFISRKRRHCGFYCKMLIYHDRFTIVVVFMMGYWMNQQIEGEYNDAVEIVMQQVVNDIGWELRNCP